MPEAMQFSLCVGVDSAAATFIATWSRRGEQRVKPQTYPQTPRGFAALQQDLRNTGVAPDVTLIVLEATGRYWVTLAVVCHDAGSVVSVTNPVQVVNYAKSLPRRSKTDARDADLLTHFAWERLPSA